MASTSALSEILTTANTSTSSVSASAIEPICYDKIPAMPQNLSERSVNAASTSSSTTSMSSVASAFSSSVETSNTSASSMQGESVVMHNISLHQIQRQQQALDHLQQQENKNAQLIPHVQQQIQHSQQHFQQTTDQCQQVEQQQQLQVQQQSQEVKLPMHHQVDFQHVLQQPKAQMQQQYQEHVKQNQQREQQEKYHELLKQIQHHVEQNLQQREIQHNHHLEYERFQRHQQEFYDTARNIGSDAYLQKQLQLEFQQQYEQHYKALIAAQNINIISTTSSAPADSRAVGLLQSTAASIPQPPLPQQQPPRVGNTEVHVPPPATPAALVAPAPIPQVIVDFSNFAYNYVQAASSATSSASVHSPSRTIQIATQRSFPEPHLHNISYTSFQHLNCHRPAM